MAVTFPVVAITPVPPVTVVAAETDPSVETRFPVLAVMLPVVAVIPVPPVRVVVDAMEPGAIKAEGMLKTTAPVVGEAVIWLAVPVTEETPKEELGSSYQFPDPVV